MKKNKYDSVDAERRKFLKQGTMAATAAGFSLPLSHVIGGSPLKQKIIAEVASFKSAPSKRILLP